MSNPEVEALLGSWVEAAAHGDAEGAASIYTDDAVCSFADGSLATGKAAIFEKWQGVFGAGVRIKADIRSSATIEVEDLVLEVATYDAIQARDGTEAARRSGRFVSIFQRQADGSLKVVYDLLLQSPAEGGARAS